MSLSSTTSLNSKLGFVIMDPNKVVWDLDENIINSFIKYFKASPNDCASYNITGFTLKITQAEFKALNVLDCVYVSLGDFSTTYYIGNHSITLKDNEDNNPLSFTNLSLQCIIEIFELTVQLSFKHKLKKFFKNLFNTKSEELSI